VVEVHACARLHIGCDEVWCLGQSPLTAAFMEARGLSLTDIFLRHVTAVARFVKDTPPHPQVWRLIKSVDQSCGSRICKDLYGIHLEWLDPDPDVYSEYVYTVQVRNLIQLLRGMTFLL
jgi:hypothetical protein